MNVVYGDLLKDARKSLSVDPLSTQTIEAITAGFKSVAGNSDVPNQ